MDNKFWRDVLFCFKCFSETLKPSNWSECLNVPIWHNMHIKVGGRTVCYQHWIEKGIFFINDLLDRNGSFLSFQIFLRDFDVRTNFLEFEGLIASIRNFIQSCTLQHLPKRNECPLFPISAMYILKGKKGCRNIYDKFIDKDIKPTSLRKWQNELNLDPRFDWKKSFGLTNKVSKDTNLQWLQSRIINRILGTNLLLFKMNLRANGNCSFCHTHQETIVHLFWECEFVSAFWESFKVLLLANCRIQNINIIKSDVLLGNADFDRTFNLLLLLAKQYIYRTKCEEKLPCIIAFRKMVTHYYKVEKVSWVKRLSLAHFDGLWFKYKGILAYNNV